LGTLIRSLYAFDTAGLILTKDRSAHLGDRASKTSAGTLNHLPISRVTNLARFLRTCQDKDYWIYYAGLDSSCHNLFETPVSWPAILILGNEHRGVRPGVAKECTLGLKIPMLQSFDSLNVAQAGVIFIAEFLRKRLYT
jgi:23S rRNA (guanosine2251-2'-O)-methyltransferase